MSDRIVGLLEIAPFMSQYDTSDSRISNIMRPLSEENLLGADANILMFVRDADRQQCRLIVSEHEISALVSLSDLQRLPVRAALFGLVTYLEILMTSTIRREFSDTDDWLLRLSEDRRKVLQKRITLVRDREPLTDALLFTLFTDKASIIHNGSIFSDRDTFENDFKRIRSLRNHLAHANNYAATPEAAIETCQTVRLIDQWSDRLLCALQ